MEITRRDFFKASAAGGVAVAWGEWGQYVQIHTADRPEPENNRVGLAVEPMSCPPNAFTATPPLMSVANRGVT